MTTKAAKFKKGDPVSWEWGNGTAYGEIHTVYKEKITRKIKGHEITRNASPDEPAYLIVQENDQEVLKSESELRHAR